MSELLMDFARSAMRRQAVRAAVIAVAATMLLAAVSSQTRIVDRLEHWLGDWRFAIAGARLPAAHPDITLLLVREESLLETGRYSPIDRALLAELIALVDGAGPRAIGLDIVFDMKTAGDAALLSAIKGAKVPIALGVFEDRSGVGDDLLPKQKAAQDAFLTKAARPVGFVNVATDFDGIVRRRASPVKGGVPLSFADRLVLASGGRLPDTPGERLDWLIEPAGGGDPFTRIFADQLTALKARPAILKRLFAKRVVIIAGGLRGMSDYHQTPLDQDDRSRTMGAEIVAQMVAQRLDGRRVREFGPIEGFAVALGAAFLAALLVLRHGRAWFDAPISLAALFGFDLLLFVAADVIAPLGVLVAAIGLASIAAEIVRRRFVGDG